MFQLRAKISIILNNFERNYGKKKKKKIGIEIKITLYKRIK